MQAFGGLLNKEDELYITYMSAYNKSDKFDLTKDIQDNVNKVRSHYAGGGTPIESVDTAINTLKVVSDSNPNTQYWLVVITDGQFGTYSSNGAQTGNIDEKILKEKFSNLLKETMPNGSKPQISYFAIGSDATTMTADESNGLFTYTAIDSKGIFDRISQIADKVSGRIRIEQDKITMVDNKTIQITTQLPMLNIAVLAQSTSVTVESVSGPDATLKQVQSAKLLYPDAPTGQLTDLALKGATFLFDNNGINTPAGTYNFEFSEAVDKNSVVIMYEPAIEMRMSITDQNGNEVTDIDDLFAGDEIDIV
jgi:hypothetical protein